MQKEPSTVFSGLRDTRAGLRVYWPCKHALCRTQGLSERDFRIYAGRIESKVPSGEDPRIRSPDAKNIC